MPTMCALMIVKTSPCWWPWSTRDVAGEVHHADHHGEARDGAEQRRRDARAAAGSRARAPRPPSPCSCVVHPARARFGSARTPNETTSPATVKRPAASHGTTRSSGVSSRPANIGPKTSGPQIAPDDDAEEHDRHPARAARRREHLGRGRARQQDDRLRGAAEREAEEDERRRRRSRSPAAVTSGRAMPEHEARRGSPACGRSGPEPPGRARPPAAPATRKIAGPRPRIPSIPVTSDDRHRAERDGELDHPRLEDEPGREQQRVPADDAHASSSYAARAGTRAPPWRRVADVRRRRARAWATRPTATTRRPRASSRDERQRRRRSRPRVGGRFDAARRRGASGRRSRAARRRSTPSSSQHALDDRGGRLGRARRP